MKLPFCAYLLSDEWTLVAYEHREQVAVADIKRRLYMLGKAKDVFKSQTTILRAFLRKKCVS